MITVWRFLEKIVINSIKYINSTTIFCRYSHFLTLLKNICIELHSAGSANPLQAASAYAIRDITLALKTTKLLLLDQSLLFKLIKEI